MTSCSPTNHGDMNHDESRLPIEPSCWLIVQGAGWVCNSYLVFMLASLKPDRSYALIFESPCAKEKLPLHPIFVEGQSVKLGVLFPFHVPKQSLLMSGSEIFL